MSDTEANSENPTQNLPYRADSDHRRRKRDRPILIVLIFIAFAISCVAVGVPLAIYTKDGCKSQFSVLNLNFIIDASLGNCCSLIGIINITMADQEFYQGVDPVNLNFKKNSMTTILFLHYNQCF